MNIEILNIKDLKPAEYNPRKKLKKNDVEYEKIKKSIETFGYVDPIIINKDKTIIGGHQRYTVLNDLGYTEIKCVVLDLSKTEEKALNIALNKISGDWDMPQLKDLLQDIDTGEIDIELTGFLSDEIESLMNQFNVTEEIERKDISNNLKSEFILSIDFENENELEKAYNDLTEKGYICRISTF